MADANRELFIEYAKHFIGKWYRWGGDDPSGFDCSGFVIECLKAVGKLPRAGDWTAAELSTMFTQVSPPYDGCLVFYHNTNKKIIHVEIMINGRLAIGASGGGSKTLTIEDAIKQNAFIKMRPAGSRQNIWGYVDPFIY